MSIISVTAPPPARLYHTQQTAYLRRPVAYNTPNIGTSDIVCLGTLPAGAFIARVYVRVNTAFNAGTTNVLTVGTSSGSNADIVAAGDVDESAAGVTEVTRGVGLAVTADTPIYVKYTQSGTAASAGAADVIVEFVPDND